MTSTARIFAVLALLVSASAIARSAQSAQPELSKAESVIITRRIAILNTPGERRMAKEWPDAKKVAEILCRPAALRTLQHQAAGVDKVFLGTDDPTTLTLESDQRLMGIGQYRTPKGWQDISHRKKVRVVETRQARAIRSHRHQFR